jgi:hypothetical protein
MCLEFKKPVRGRRTRGWRDRILQMLNPVGLWTMLDYPVVSGRLQKLEVSMCHDQINLKRKLIISE